MSQYDNVKSRLQKLDIKIINTKEDFTITKIFQLECPKGHQTEQKNTSMINRLSAYSNKKCTNICGTCCNEDGILQKILPVMEAKGFELIELKDDHLNIIYKCVCGNIASSNTKNIKKSNSCAKCLNHHRNYSIVCEDAKTAGFEIEMSFKEYLENHEIVRMKHLSCNQEIQKPFSISMHFVCKHCTKAAQHQEKEVIQKTEFKYGYKCSINDCLYYAIYLGTTQPLYCDMHYPNEGKKILFAGYKHRICIEEDCDKRASFNYKIGMKQIFCQSHMQPKMINVASIKCIDCQENTARYTYKKDYPKANYCKVCRDKKSDKEKIVDCREKLCNPPDCWRQAIFGYTRTNKKEWKCKEHKKDDMVDVKNIFRTCQFQNCASQANYNYSNQKRALFCKKHKEVGMIDMYHIKCHYDNCIKRPCYNYKSETAAKYCSTHKLPLMIDVISPRCQEENCKHFPFYNYSNFTFPIFCSKHQLIGMVDVRHLICEQCTSQAVYGYLGKTSCRCAAHKELGMLRQSNRKCCKNACIEYAQYGNIGFMPVFCENHKDPSHINLIEQKCKKCNLKGILNLDNLCLYCEIPEDKIIMKKQYQVKKWLDEQKYKYLSYDKPIDNGICNSHRPDFVFESNNNSFSIVLEVDEHMHKRGEYTPECEEIRMINISQSLGQPTIFIRFNPDSYHKDGQKISNHVPLDRFKILRKILDKYLDTSVERIQKMGFCSMIQLFYDDFDKDNIKYSTILGFD